MNEPTRRRWLQYGLRSLVGLMLLAALFCGYTAWWMKRLQQAEDRAAAAAKAAKEERVRAQMALEMADEARLQAEVARVRAEAAVLQERAARRAAEIEVLENRALSGTTNPPPAESAEDEPPAGSP